MPARARASRAVVRQAHLLGRNNEKFSNSHPPPGPAAPSPPHSHRRLPRYRHGYVLPAEEDPQDFVRVDGNRRRRAPVSCAAAAPTRAPSVARRICDHRRPGPRRGPRNAPALPVLTPNPGDPLPPRPRDTVRLPEGARAPTSVGPNPHVPSPRPAPTRRHLGDGPSKVSPTRPSLRRRRPATNARVPSIAATQGPPTTRSKSHPSPPHHLSLDPDVGLVRGGGRRARMAFPPARVGRAQPLFDVASPMAGPRDPSRGDFRTTQPRRARPGRRRRARRHPETHLFLRRRPTAATRRAARRTRRSRIVGRVFHRERARDSRRLRSRRCVRPRRGRRRRSLGRDVGVSRRGSSSLGFRRSRAFRRASGRDAASDAADALALREEAHATETRVRVAEHEYAIAAAEADALRRGAAMDDAVAEARRATAAAVARRRRRRRRFAPSWTRRCARLHARDARRRRTRRLPRTRPRRRARRWSV